MPVDNFIVGPVFKFSWNSYLDLLPRFNISPTAKTELDQAKLINESGVYYWNAMVFPTGDNDNLDFSGFQTRDGTLNIPAYSWLVQVTSYSSQPEGFKYSLFDKAGKVYNTDPALGFHRVNAGNHGSFAENGIYSGGRFSLSPMIVLRASQLQITVTNLSGNTNRIQLMFEFATPINKPNTGLNIVKT